MSPRPSPSRKVSSISCRGGVKALPECSCGIEKKEKKKKDKNAPKRPITAFFAYIKGRRENLKKEQPKLSNTELVSVGS